jgi:thymidylate synthase
MAYIDRDYHRLLNKILRDGYVYEDPNRKNVYRTEILSYTIRHQFKDGFPLVSTRALNYNNIITELLWFLKGDTNIKYLVNKGCNIWNKDAYKYYLKKNNTDLESMNIKEFIETIRVMKDTDLLKPWFSNGYVLGDLGPVYGHQWRPN